MASHKYGRQVTRLRSNQAGKCLGLQEWLKSVRPTSLQRLKPPTLLMKLFVLQQLLKLGRLVYRMTSHKYGRQVTRLMSN